MVRGKQFYGIGPGDPADVRDAAEHVCVVVVPEDVLVSEGCVEQITCCAVSDTLRCASNSRCVQNEEVVLRVHHLWFAI